MDYKIKNNLAEFIISLRKLFEENFSEKDKNVKREFNLFIKKITKNSKIFIDNIKKLDDQEEQEAKDRYII